VTGLVRSLAGLALAALAGSGCAPRLAGPVADPALALRPTWNLARPSLMDDGDVTSLRDAVRQSLAWLEREPDDRQLVFGPRRVTAARQRRALARLLDVLATDPSPADLRARVTEWFEVLESVGGERGAMLVTGYFEPVIEAAESRSEAYAVPILGPPEDLVEAALGSFDPRLLGERIAGRVEGRWLVPYWTRAEIEAGRLAGRGLELYWARDPVDVFFMEIQGSGALRLPDGGEVRLGYAASNGRPYRAIGRLLVEEGRMPREAVSLPSIRAWLAAHPEERARVLRYNESYVFFRRLDGPPVGSLGVPLTPGRSVATDPRLFPPGALAFLRTARPVAGPAGRVAWRPLARFVVNQDSGGAIRGAGRVDVFWGRGPAAELAAGLMKEPGALYFLVPKAE
jgi:membrane-bound lytic murein transglycosylase A